jgi:hypothetical protein
MLLVGTRKGAFIYRSDSARRKWRVEGPRFLGNIVNHLVLDPRDGRTLLPAAKTGHLGPTVFRSLDGGRNWDTTKFPIDRRTGFHRGERMGIARPDFPRFSVSSGFLRVFASNILIPG